MKIRYVLYNSESFGSKDKSLKILRDTILEKAKRNIAVVEIPTENVLCGFLIFDKEWEIAIFTGDGFRNDNKESCGGGYERAKAFFTLFGIDVILWRKAFNTRDILWDSEEKFQNKFRCFAQGIADGLVEKQFVRAVLVG